VIVGVVGGVHGWRIGACALPLHPLLDWRAAQVEGAMALSVVVRSGPIMIAVNGTARGQPLVCLSLLGPP
jgi:hypothetical protein